LIFGITTALSPIVVPDIVYLLVTNPEREFVLSEKISHKILLDIP